MKKQFSVFSVTAAGAMALLVSGCSTPTTLQQPVGPNPAIGQNASPDGFLQVYSAPEKQRDVRSDEYTYIRRSDYEIFDSNGHLMERVANLGNVSFNATPKSVELAPGTYRVKALAGVGEGEWVTVPVVIDSGRTTEVHLNGNWNPPPNTPNQDLVYAPTGFPMGWRAGSLPTS